MGESARNDCTHIHPSERTSQPPRNNRDTEKETVTTGTVRVREEALLPCSQGSRYKGDNCENTGCSGIVKASVTTNLGLH